MEKPGTDLILPLALSALQPQHQLLGGLGLLPQDGLGLTSETLLLTVVPLCKYSIRIEMVVVVVVRVVMEWLEVVWVMGDDGSDLYFTFSFPEPAWTQRTSYTGSP